MFYLPQAPEPVPQRAPRFQHPSARSPCSLWPPAFFAMRLSSAFMSAARLGREMKTLEHAWRQFRANRSPKIIGGAIVAAGALTDRPWICSFTWRDAVAAAAMLLVYPFGEWAIHVHLLHMGAPSRFRGRRVELATARRPTASITSDPTLGLILLAPPGGCRPLLLSRSPPVLAVFFRDTSPFFCRSGH